ncbi:putative major facilitator superfamily transporter, partial [Aureobasidium melanogenum]
MGHLFRSRKNKSSGGPSTVSLENHEHTDESMSKNETLAAVREASVDKDAVSKLEGDGSAVIPGAEDESKYPTGPKLWLLVLGLCLAIWVIALDNSIIATAIPKITTQWPDALNDVGWIGSSYLLTTTSLQPSFGKVYTYFDVKWTYLSALIIFEVGSVICAAATSSTMLIVGRAVAGVGAAALFSGGMTIIGFIAPLRKRAIYIASLSSMFGIASVVGPLLGGVFTDHATWRWCFWINLPFGGIGLVTVFFFFENPKRRHANMTFKEKIRQIDLLGALLLICAIVCLLLALQWGGTTYPWSDSKVWGCLLGFGLLISIFIALQIKIGDRATLPPRILVKNRTVLVSALYAAFFAMGLYTHIFYLPFYFQAVKNTSAEGSGI